LLMNGFVQRYRTREGVDGLPPGEGAFVACTFWLADNYALQGRHDEAERLFTRLLGLCNDVGLLAEQYDAAGGRQVGNFPQAFLPAIPVGVVIDRQPNLPSQPVLGLRIASPLIAAAAGPLAGFFKSLPPWVRLDGAHVSIDLEGAAASYGAAEAFGYLRAIAL